MSQAARFQQQIGERIVITEQRRQVRAERHPGSLFLPNAPVLLANAAAIAAGAALVETEVDGQAWVQNPFPYHVKCLAALRGAYAGLDGDARASVDGWLAGSGVALLFG